MTGAVVGSTKALRRVDNADAKNFDGRTAMKGVPSMRIEGLRYSVQRFRRDAASASGPSEARNATQALKPHPPPVSLEVRRGSP